MISRTDTTHEETAVKSPGGRGKAGKLFGMTWWLIVGWSALVAGSLLWNLYQARQSALELARAEAKLTFNKGMSYRLWAADKGGGYIPVLPESLPNPHLYYLKERDIKTPFGDTLTLVHPAYMTRRVQELTARLFNARGHISSLKPLNPENAPDPWEKKALEALVAGADEVMEAVTEAGQPHIRYMRPWRAEKSCLNCHAAQGYQEGNVLGGVSVNIPLQHHFEAIKAQAIPLTAGHGVIWVLGLTGILLRERHIRRDLNHRREAEESLRRAHDALEDMVRERTAELERSREELRRTSEDYRIVADFTYNWEVWLNGDQTIRYISPSCQRISGYSAAEFFQRPELMREIILPGDRELWDRHRCEVAKENHPHEIQVRIVKPDGAIRWIEHVCQPVITENGNFLGVRASNRDITDRKQAELDLKEALLNIEKLKEQLEIDYSYLQEEIKVGLGFDQLIGKSEALRYVLFNVEQVASSDTTVLILGETGTGKELIARAIHEASPRSHRALVKVDCAALTPSLIESELFGHEKGAFTGATSQKVGRFELAHGSTLFLDEIGELPLELQGKLLRLLQAGEFERLGSTKTIQVDVRIIAATNRVLEDEVKAGRFREDLYYRLHVFPITLPPLRKRKEDIPLLAQFFMERFAKKLGKDLKKIPPAVMETLQGYSWPGNIRELENIIERAVVHSRGPALQLAGIILAPVKGTAKPSAKSLVLLEKDYIRQILEEVNWKIEGEHGAAAKLGLNPSTLRGRLRKFGIIRK